MINIKQTYNAKITILLQISQPDSYIMQNYKLNQDNISFLPTYYKKTSCTHQRVRRQNIRL